MSATLKSLMGITDLLFLFYWFVSALYLLAWVDLPATLLFNDYHNPRVFAWNWSFLPLDLAFSITGLWAIRLEARGSAAWRGFAIISLLLSASAGGMAIAYWIILLEFDPNWFIPNLVLFLWPLFFLPKLVRESYP